MDNIICYFARHGSTDLNTANCFRGSANPSLSPKGYREANQLAHYLQAIRISFIVASAKKRSMETAEVICLAQKLECESNKDLKVIPNDLLFAWNVGKFSGKPKDKENLDELQQYIDDPDCVVPGGESLNNFRSKIRPLVTEALDESDKSGVPGLLVVHSSVIHELGEMFHKNHNQALVKPGGLAAVYISKGTLKAQAIFKPETGEHSEAS